MKQHLCLKGKDAKTQHGGNTILSGHVDDVPDGEVGCSRNVLEPLVIVCRNHRIRLPEKQYILFWYIYDLYRTEGRAIFGYAELAAVLTRNGFETSRESLADLLWKLCSKLKRIYPPFVLSLHKGYVSMSEDTVVPFSLCFPVSRYHFLPFPY